MSALGALAAGAQPTRQEQGSAFGDISSAQFTELILSELSNQDPLEPNDTGALIEQLSSIRSIESDAKLTEQLEAMVVQTELASAATLIGALVSGITEQNQRTADAVISVTRTSEGAVLNLSSGARMRMDRVDEIIAPARLGGPPGSDPDQGDQP